MTQKAKNASSATSYTPTAPRQPSSGPSHISAAEQIHGTIAGINKMGFVILRLSKTFPRALGSSEVMWEGWTLEESILKQYLRHNY